MKKIAILALCAFLIGSGVTLAQKVAHVEQPADVPSFVGYVQDEFVVILKDRAGTINPRMALDGNVEIGIPDFDAISRRFAVSGLRKQFSGAIDAVGSPTEQLARHYKIKFAQGSLENAMSAYGQHPMVERVEPIGIHTTFATPNDGWYVDQWHLNQTNDADMDAPEAWDYETGDATVVVAIFDTGVRYFHKDLGGANASYSNPTTVDGNMWINWAEKNGSAGVDDDGNGYIDDWVGWDFVDGGSNCWSGEDCNVTDNDPRDFNGHGTHCAGNVGAINNNGYATCAPSGGWGDGTLQPTANGVKVMACRIGWSGVYIIYEVGYVRMDFAAEAFYYAADNGAKIVSCSWGSSNTGGIAAAIDYFLASGGMVFHAAGNDGSQSADYLGSRSDVINVAATDSTDCKADFSTYGTWVDISAPGTGIWSSYHNHDDPAGDYVAPIDGTSMSCPLVASVAALIWSQNPSWTAAQVETKLLESVDDIYALGCNSAYAGKLGSGRVNAFLAVSGGPPPPVAAFSGSPTSGCAALAVDFTDESTGDITSRSWIFGDGGTSAAQNPSYTYNDPGTYTVSLTVTGPGGSDTETKTGYITVNDVPTAAFTGSPTSGEVPLTVNFTNTSSGATSYSWDFGDTQTSTATNPSHTYTQAGTYTVTLTATNSCGFDDEVKIDYITVTCIPPVADFSGSPTSGEVPLTVNFTDLSTGATSWDWDFGDTQTSTTQNPSHTYTSAGTYTVALTATNSCGNDTETKIDYITVTCTPPVAAFSGSPTSGDAPLTVDFTDMSTGATSWLWDFGDTETSTAQNPTHTYTAAGTYTVTLTATNSCGSDGETKTDYITVTEGGAWTVITYDDFESGWGNYTDGGGDCYLYTGGTYAHQGSNAGAIQDNSGVASSFYHTVGYDVSGYTDLEVEFWYMPVSMDRTGEDFWVQYYDGSTWQTVATFDKGVDFENNNFYHEVVTILNSTYNFPTNAKLRFMCDASGNQDDVYIDEIEFRGSGGSPTPPVAEFSGSPTSGVVPLTVNFTDQSTGNPTSWSWDFGDGVGTSTAQNPSYEYTIAGIYTVTLTATNAVGSDDEVKVDYITVTTPPPPTANFVGNPTSGVVPLTVNFTDQSTGNPTSWSWDFGDGVGTSTAQNPSYEYTSIGTYTVTLTATNAYGSDDEIKTDYITVSEGGSWTVITYDDFEGGWGNYSDGGGDCSRYTSGTYAHQGSAALDIQDNSGVASSFYHTVGHDVSGYTELEVEFWFMAVSMDNSKEDFWLQYYDGSTWQTVETWARSIDFDNNVFYNEVVIISNSQYNFPTDAKLRFMCDASANRDDVYIDEIEFRGMSGTSGFSGLAKTNSLIPEEFNLSQNYPNPFNPVTEISFSLPTLSNISLEIYNVLGQRVAVLAEGSYNAGHHTIIWDASLHSSGVYFYRLQVGEVSETKKMILMK